MKQSKLLINSIVAMSIFCITSCSENSPTDSHPQQEQTTINLLNDMSSTFNLSQANENPISIQVLDEQEEPIADISVTFQVTSGDGELLLNDEQSTLFNIITDSEGVASIYWLPTEGTSNILNVSINEEGYSSEPLILCAILKFSNEVQLMSFSWFETNDIEFPSVLPPYFMEYDGRVLESNHFLTFSDASTDQVRLEFAILAETAFIEILDEFEINNGSELGILGRDSKIKIYTRQNYDQQPQQYTFDYGFLLYGTDSPWMNVWYPGGYPRFKNEVKHEVMHMVQFLMGVSYPMCDDWFMEGIAEEISGGAHVTITTSQQLEDWIANPTFTVNPIDVHSTDDFPPPYMETSGQYYPMFHLIMEYLLSDRGLGRNYIDVKNMFSEIAESNDFPTAFLNHFGISTDELKQNLFDRLRNFMNN